LQEPHWASPNEIKAFHAADYIDFLQRVSPSNQKDLSSELQKCTYPWRPSLRLNHTP
jgi:acetoin utilization deacetylase AcuC-like enzyme